MIRRTRSRNLVTDGIGRIGDRFHRGRYDWSIRTAFVDDVRDISNLAMAPSRLGRFDRSNVSTLDAGFVADPFVLRRHDWWYLFAEVWDRRLNRGVIGLAVSDDGMSWSWEGVVLQEPFHLSYPQILVTSDRVLMVPETHEVGAVRAYESTGFPHAWTYCGDLFALPSPSDASIFEHSSRWWCFVESSDNRSDSLRLLSSDRLEPGSKWEEHPLSPIVSNDATRARPAGSPVLIDGALHRLSQTCQPRYGFGVRAHRIEQLTMAEYVENDRGEILLHASGRGWNRSGSHHLSVTNGSPAGKHLVAIDGY